MNWSVFFTVMGIGFSIGAIPIFVEGISRVDYDGDYRVLHLAVVLVVVVAACFGLGAGLS